MSVAFVVTALVVAITRGTGVLMTDGAGPSRGTRASLRTPAFALSFAGLGIRLATTAT